MISNDKLLRAYIKASLSGISINEVITGTPVTDMPEIESTGAYEAGPFFLPQGLFDFLLGGPGVPGSIYSIVESMFTTSDGWVGLALLAYVFRADLEELERSIMKWIEENYGRTAEAIEEYPSNKKSMGEEKAMDIIQDAIKDDTSMLFAGFLKALGEDEVVEMLKSLDELFDTTGTPDRSLEKNYHTFFANEAKEGRASKLAELTQDQLESAVGNIIIPGIYNGMINRAQQYSVNLSKPVGIDKKVEDKFQGLYITVDPYGADPILPSLLGPPPGP